ncbi:MAG: hypothetical protein AAFY57_17605 [Cyanobacteria bacterium J06642_2]
MDAIELEIEGSGAVPATEALLQWAEVEGNWQAAGPETPRGALATIATIVAITAGSLTIAEKIYGWYQRWRSQPDASEQHVDKVVVVVKGKRLVLENATVAQIQKLLES